MRQNNNKEKKAVKKAILYSEPIDSIEKALENYRILRDKNRYIELLKEVKGLSYE